MKRQQMLIGTLAVALLVALATGLTCAQQSSARSEASAQTASVGTASADNRVGSDIVKNDEPTRNGPTHRIQGDTNVAKGLNSPVPACVKYEVSGPGESTVKVPSFCIDGMCSIVMYDDATMGAFGPGFSWPAFYTQSSADDSWIGGPSITLGGFGFSDGAGTNGDGSSDGVFLGGMTVGGGYVSLYDDGGVENSPDLWTIEATPDEDLTEASFYICPLTSCVQYDVSAEAEWTVPVPDFCVDEMCTILMWNDATMGAFGPGIYWQVFYKQSSADDSWIGGPDVSIGGVSFSDGAGVNGDAYSDDVFLGGQTVEGGYARLRDDGAPENSPDLWTIDFVPDEDLTEASFYVCPLTSCVQYDVSAPVAVESAVEVPEFCIDGMCSIVMYDDATMGAFGPGFSWPAFYTQSSADDSWIGGPDLSIAGFSYSEGAGVNGDASGEGVFVGGMTVGGGYVSLYDDGSPESSRYLWTIDFAPDEDLTEASFHICPWTCVQRDVPLYRVYLPLLMKGWGAGASEGWRDNPRPNHRMGPHTLPSALGK